MARVAKEIVVNAPRDEVYNQWTRYEEFPEFMEGVAEVRRLDDRRIEWRAEIGGRSAVWEAEIREQLPNEKIVWHAVSGDENAGLVRFESAGDGQTNVHLEMSYEPEGVVDRAGDILGMVESRVEGDLKRFKEFIEERRGATGPGGREIENPDAPGGHTRGQGSPSDATDRIDD
jgi:uncharacterized membrane protein